MNKNNKKYKRFAIDHVSRLINKLDIDVYRKVKEYLFEMALGDQEPAEKNTDPMDIEEVRERPMNLVIQANSFKALARFFACETLPSQQENSLELCDFYVGNSADNVWNVRVGILDGLMIYLEALIMDEKCIDPSMVKKLVEALLVQLEDLKYSVVRKKAIEVLKVVVERFKEMIQDRQGLVGVLQKKREGEKMPIVEGKMKIVVELLV